ncbi:hypothetical protein MG1601_750 [Mycoplasmoides gallisepticum]|uniref:Uncharacterized protein n=1 Tax=Mycoplasmoides gallisepticum S6 TaxID=1006581 RepID=A0A0F6CLR4_MYCGL|nr:hypothetical protein GCW_03995 [Mycoplasmoides gallisepticum S6]
MLFKQKTKSSLNNYQSINISNYIKKRLISAKGFINPLRNN